MYLSLLLLLALPLATAWVGSDPPAEPKLPDPSTLTPARPALTKRRIVESLPSNTDVVVSDQVTTTAGGSRASRTTTTVAASVASVVLLTSAAGGAYVYKRRTAADFKRAAIRMIDLNEDRVKDLGAEKLREYYASSEDVCHREALPRASTSIWL